MSSLFPRTIIMIRPHGFRVEYSINPFMDQSIPVNGELAMKQWEAVKSTYEKLNFDVQVYEGDPQFPDMVFCANQFFSYPQGVLLSNMRHPQRQGEVEFFAQWFQDKNLNRPHNFFEGMGDLLWCYERGLLFGGYGYRTEEETLREVEQLVDRPIMKLKLINEKFYHLDTCLSVLNKRQAIYVPSAFEQEGISLLKNHFEDLIEVDEAEAEQFLACNAHCPDGKNVLVELGALNLQEKLKSHQLTVHPLDTSEFRKAGGSIFCIKQQFFSNQS